MFHVNSYLNVSFCRQKYWLHVLSNPNCRFFSLHEKLVSCGFGNGCSALDFSQVALQLIDRAATYTQNKDALWQMWGTIVNPVSDHIAKVCRVFHKWGIKVCSFSECCCRFMRWVTWWWGCLGMVQSVTHRGIKQVSLYIFRIIKQYSFLFIFILVITMCTVCKGSSDKDIHNFKAEDMHKCKWF